MDEVGGGGAAAGSEIIGILARGASGESGEILAEVRLIVIAGSERHIDQIGLFDQQRQRMMKAGNPSVKLGSHAEKVLKQAVNRADGITDFGPQIGKAHAAHRVFDAAGGVEYPRISRGQREAVEEKMIEQIDLLGRIQSGIVQPIFEFACGFAKGGRQIEMQIGDFVHGHGQEGRQTAGFEANADQMDQAELGNGHRVMALGVQIGEGDGHCTALITAAEVENDVRFAIHEDFFFQRKRLLGTEKPVGVDVRLQQVMRRGKPVHGESPFFAIISELLSEAGLVVVSYRFSVFSQFHKWFG